MAIFIFVSNINTEEDVDRLKGHLSPYQDLIYWTVDLTDDEKVLRVVTEKLKRCEVVSLVRNGGYDCHKMDW